jgi:hypothetical protein
MGMIAPAPTLKVGKVGKFTADMSNRTTFIPAGLGRPNFVSKVAFSYR